MLMSNIYHGFSVFAIINTGSLINVIDGIIIRMIYNDMEVDGVYCTV